MNSYSCCPDTVQKSCTRAAPAHSKGAIVPLTNAEASDAMRALSWKATMSRFPSAATMALHLIARATPRSRYFGKRLARRRKAMRKPHSATAVMNAEPRASKPRSVGQGQDQYAQHTCWD